MSAVGGTGSRLLIAGVLTALAPFAGAAPRILLEAEGTTVHMEGELRCGRDAEITVLARDPALFAGDSARLQSLSDATHALLGFECRNLPGMVVRGRLEGLQSTAYQAVAGPAGDWRLRPSRTMQISAPGSGTSRTAWRSPAVTRASIADFAVRDLRRGMGVQASMDVLRNGFGAEPLYHAERRLLSVSDGGCPIAGEFLRREFSPRPGDACLEAKFNGDGPPRLEHLSFAQVVDRDQAASIRGALEQRYGRPAYAGQSGSASTRLGWGQRLPEATGRYELEALIEVRESTTVLVLQLQGAEQAPQFKVDF